MICGLIIAVALGTGAVVRILSSVFIGEENREDLSALIYIAFTKAMLLTAVMTVLVVACAPLISVPEDPIKNVGIRLVHALTGIIEYQCLLGMNILSITIA